MLKIWSMKQKQQQEAAAAAAAENDLGNNGTSNSGKKKVTAAELRVQKDLAEVSLGSTMKINFPDPDDILHFVLTIEPDEGLYLRGRFTFDFTVPTSFPHEPPKVQCRETIYHPNIDLEGKVCLNILREDWKPVLDLNAVVVGLQFLFLEPNPADPLNTEAATALRENRNDFARRVQQTMAGAKFQGTQFSNTLIR